MLHALIDTHKSGGRIDPYEVYGRVPKWTKGTDCKSVIRGFESHRGLLQFGAGRGDIQDL